MLSLLSLLLNISLTVGSAISVQSKGSISAGIYDFIHKAETSLQ